jgi:acetyltransferase-like isoleucine patch superfamily enzyme
MGRYPTTTVATDIVVTGEFSQILAEVLGADPVGVGGGVLAAGPSRPEKEIVTIGDRCPCNRASAVQRRPREDAAFTSDRSALGSGVTLGVGARARYGVRTGDGSSVAADAFPMKREEVRAGAQWGGNPARDKARRTGRVINAVGVGE